MSSLISISKIKTLIQNAGIEVEVASVFQYSINKSYDTLQLCVKNPSREELIKLVGIVNGYGLSEFQVIVSNSLKNELLYYVAPKKSIYIEQEAIKYDSINKPDGEIITNSDYLSLLK